MDLHPSFVDLHSSGVFNLIDQDAIQQKLGKIWENYTIQTNKKNKSKR